MKSDRAIRVKEMQVVCCAWSTTFREVIKLERKIELGHQRFYYFYYVIGPVSGSERCHK